MQNKSRFWPTHGRWITTVSAALLIAGCGGSSDPANVSASPKLEQVKAVDSISVNDGNGGVRSAKASVDAYVQPAEPQAKTLPLSPKSRNRKPVVTAIDLGSVSAEKTMEMRQGQTKRGMGKAMQVGFAREVIQAKDSASTGQLLQWSATPEGGQVAALAFTSGGAEGMRIGLVVQSLSSQATIRFYASGSNDAFEVSGKTINDALASNLASGDTTEDGRTYWGPFLKGASGTLEIELPKDALTASTLIAVPRISHFFLDPLGKESLTGGLQTNGADAPKSGAASCNVDVTCNLPLSTASKAVAAMEYLKNGATYICTGTLLNDAQSSGTPYFLSADHCISTQTVASTLNTYWFFRSSGCNNGVLNPNYVLQIGGATLLFNRNYISGTAGVGPVGTDTSFMRLNTTPPAGAVFSGWSATRQAVNNGTTFTGLHNPKGDLQKYSLGLITNYSYKDVLNTTYSNTAGVNFGMYKVNWFSGVTEGGSSGSGLFLDASSANPKLVGQLWGGASSCLAPAAPDLYGRFDIAFQDGLARWLSPDTGAVFRFYNSDSGSHFYSTSNSEVQTIRNSYSQFRYEGPAYFVSVASNTGLSPVYRFRNLVNGSYLWTISESERISINQNYRATFIEEGVAWQSSQVAAPGYVPLYRFRNLVNSTYFYTASEAEKDNVVLNYKTTLVLEGVAYYVKNSL